MADQRNNFMSDQLISKRLYDALLIENHTLKKQLQAQEKTATQAMSSNTSLFLQKEGMLKGVGKLKENITRILNEMKINKKQKEIALSVARGRRDNNMSIKLEAEIGIVSQMIREIETKLIKNIA